MSSADLPAEIPTTFWGFASKLIDRYGNSLLGCVILCVVCGLAWFWYREVKPDFGAFAKSQQAQIEISSAQARTAEAQSVTTSALGLLMTQLKETLEESRHDRQQTVDMTTKLNDSIRVLELKGRP